MTVIMMLATASRCVNRDAPSIAPKNSASADSCLRRWRASVSSMSPAFKSESIDICLPGNASRVNRAVTSEIRTAPWLMTTY